MTEPDDRPGSDDPEDPSELLRLIGRTVPRSPHASASPQAEDDPEDRPALEPEAPPAATAPVTTGPSDRDARSGPAEGENVPLDVSRESRRDPTGSDPSHGSVPSRAEDPRTEDPEPENDQDPEDPEFHELADDTELEHALEALLLVVDAPVDEASLATALHQTPSRIRQTLHRMSLAYTADRRGIDLRRAGEGWRFYTRDRYAPYVEKMLMDGQRARLTRAALETLAVVAYRQPVTRARVSAVRGVNCDGVLRTLLTRGLVEEAGTEEHTGGTLFRTTELFLERLGISSVAELPPLAPLLPDIDAIDDLDS
ncbi:SMC-Scp complex subunit ScpB [Pseudonocardia sp. ICBG1142]|uniref:SMC-Scp complex subunit ScpB n=1 Tax=Pseudonocardia sp. ICBG1142 TaxID=2846760 RepID=UPI0035A81B52